MTWFLIIGGAGLLLVLISLVVGDVVDGLLDLDFLDGDLFSLTSIAAFIGAFGFGGALGLSVLDLMPVAIACGLVIGFLAAWGAVKLTRALKSGEDSATFRSDSLIGQPARVITAIPQSGFGEITLTASGHVRKFTARADGEVAAGDEVWVSAIVSPTAVEVTRVTHTPELNT